MRSDAVTKGCRGVAAVMLLAVGVLVGPLVGGLAAQEKTLEEGVEGWVEGEESASDMGDLAKTSQNPVGSLISLPLQNNTNFGFGPGTMSRMSSTFSLSFRSV